VTTTLREHPSEIADNVSAHNALYRYLKKKGKIKTRDGGYEIVRPLDYSGGSSTYQRYAGYDTLNLNAVESFTAARFPWVQAAVHVVASGYELRTNNGKNQIIDLAESRVTHAMRDAANNMSLDLYSSGSLTNQMGGLSSIIQTAGTGTVGGIDSSTYTFWQNKFREISGTNTWTKATLKGEMNALWLNLVRGTDKPDLIVSTNDFYAAYWESLQDIQRYTSNTDTAGFGFPALKYITADLIFDSNANFTTTGETMFFLNTDYLELIVHKQANWTQLDEKVPLNQDAVVIPVIWQGQLVCSNRALQGRLLDAA
jgi:hypothetical protein